MKAAIACALSKLRKQPLKQAVSGPHRLSAVSRGRVANTIPVLVVSKRSEDHQRVRESLEKGRWLVVEARDWSAALSLFRCLVFPVIVCDRDFQWPELAVGWRTAPLVLLADRWDPDLWENLVQEGVFDVLLRPLHGDDVLAVLDAAYRQWADGLPSQSVAAEPSRSTLTRSRTAS
jgi:DNA-binding response OmpR family regulator